jgi:transcription elongation factor Elf1
MMKDLDRIKKILEIKAIYQKLETCVVCGAKTGSVYFYNTNDSANLMLCSDCNQLQISADDVKGDAQLEYLFKRIYGK